MEEEAREPVYVDPHGKPYFYGTPAYPFDFPKTEDRQPNSFDDETGEKRRLADLAHTEPRRQLGSTALNS